MEKTCGAAKRRKKHLPPLRGLSWREIKTQGSRPGLDSVAASRLRFELCRLPEQFQSELDFARPRIRRLVGSKGRGRQNVLEASKARVVEYVEEVRAELNFDVLSKLGILHDDPIELRQSIQAKNVPAKRSVLTDQRLRQRITTRVRIPLRRSRVHPACGR